MVVCVLVPWAVVGSAAASLAGALPSNSCPGLACCWRRRHNQQHLEFLKPYCCWWCCSVSVRPVICQHTPTQDAGQDIGKILTNQNTAWHVKWLYWPIRTQHYTAHDLSPRTCWPRSKMLLRYWPWYTSQHHNQSKATKATFNQQLNF